MNKNHFNIGFRKTNAKLLATLTKDSTHEEFKELAKKLTAIK